MKFSTKSVFSVISNKRWRSFLSFWILKYKKHCQQLKFLLFLQNFETSKNSVVWCALNAWKFRKFFFDIWAFASNILIYLMNRLKKTTFFFWRIEKKTFLFLNCLNAIILFLRTKRIFCILLILLLICAMICVAILFFRFSMTFLSKCFIIKFKSRIDDFSIIVDFAAETCFEAKLLMIDVNARRFWSISLKIRFSKRANFGWIMNLNFMTAKTSKNSRTRWTEIILTFVVFMWTRKDLLCWKKVWQCSFVENVDADAFNIGQILTLDFILSTYSIKRMIKCLMKWDLRW